MNNSNKQGYDLIVDLAYFSEIHGNTAVLPLAPEMDKVCEEVLTDYIIEDYIKEEEILKRTKNFMITQFYKKRVQCTFQIPEILPRAEYAYSQHTSQLYLFIRKPSSNHTTPSIRKRVQRPKIFHKRFLQVAK